MATKTKPAVADVQHSADAVGDMAGQIWHYLNLNGSVTLSKLAREIKAPRDLVMQGIGWLARENTIVYVAGERFKKVALATD